MYGTGIVILVLCICIHTGTSIGAAKDHWSLGAAMHPMYMHIYVCLIRKIWFHQMIDSVELGNATGGLNHLEAERWNKNLRQENMASVY
jgi:hypothetical protein